MSAEANGGFAVESPYSAATFNPGLCAILIAALAVSVAIVPVDPADSAFANKVVHAVDPAPFEFTQLASTFASVLISACDTVPFPAGVVASATPVDSVSRFAAFANAFAIPVCASAVPELPTCVASVANPAIAYAAAIVDTSFIAINGVAAKKLPAAGFAPDPGFPPSAYK